MSLLVEVTVFVLLYLVRWKKCYVTQLGNIALPTLF